MAVWYMVKRLDTDKIYGHNTWEYSPVTSAMVDIGDVEVQRHPDGTPHHLIVYVDAKDEHDARFMAEVCFDLATQPAPAAPGREE